MIAHEVDMLASLEANVRFIGSDKSLDSLNLRAGDCTVSNATLYVWTGSEWSEVNVHEESHKIRIVPAVRICPSCGAPVDQKLESCPYCGVNYPMMRI